MSHICSIPKDDLTVFQDPCLGTGPIKDTIHSLQSAFSEGFDEIKWMLFCEELSRYVTVESLSGVPYRHLEEVNINSNLRDYNRFNECEAGNILNQVEHTLTRAGLQKFIQYYLKNGHLAISYQQDHFIVGMSYYEYILDVSNAFIDWINKYYVEKSLVSRMFDRQIINRAIVAGGKFFDPNGSRSLDNLRLEDYIGKKVCTFKGNDVTLKISGSTEFTPQESIVLSHSLSMYILNNILKIINYHYTNEYTRQHQQDASSSSSATALPAPTHQSVYYL